jgi:hypothetical protein
VLGVFGKERCRSTCKEQQRSIDACLAPHARLHFPGHALLSAALAAATSDASTSIPLYTQLPTSPRKLLHALPRVAYAHSHLNSALSGGRCTADLSAHPTTVLLASTSPIPTSSRLDHIA